MTKKTKKLEILKLDLEESDLLLAYVHHKLRCDIRDLLDKPELVLQSLPQGAIMIYIDTLHRLSEIVQLPDMELPRHSGPTAH